MRFRLLFPAVSVLVSSLAMAWQPTPPKSPAPSSDKPPSDKAAPQRTDDAPTEPLPSTMITDPTVSSVELLRRDASLLLNTVQSPSVRQYLFNTNFAPALEQPRVVYYDKATGEAYSPDDFASLSDVRRKAFTPLTLDEKFYYHTRYGSPHAYARPFDLLCQAASAEGNCFGPGKRLLDFGNGGIVHLRLLAIMGMHATGVDVDPLLRAFFRNPEDQGKILGSEENVIGFLQLGYGPWPADVSLKQSIGGDYDFIISKNTLKKGYVHPDKASNIPPQVVLGVTDEVFVDAIFQALKPGGLMMVYNICPAQSPDKYIPWADGKNPFPKELWEKAGFKILNFDSEDQAGVKAMAHALGWDAGQDAIDIEKDLFAWYTIVQKPVQSGDAKPSTEIAPVAPPTKK